MKRTEKTLFYEEAAFSGWFGLRIRYIVLFQPEMKGKRSNN
ncbi:hypothetical protein [Paenibacillus sonchi]|nr:hypothetical protein [Paenibacillus sonchi]